MPAGRQGKDGHALGQQALGTARPGSLGEHPIQPMLRPKNLAQGDTQPSHRARCDGGRHWAKETVLNIGFFSQQIFFLFLSKTAEVQEEFCISSIKGSSPGPWSTVRQRRKPGWQQGHVGRDALPAPVCLLASGDREDRRPSVCVPHREGTRGTWQLPMLPLL